MKQKRSVKKLRTHAGNFLFLFPAMFLYCFVVIIPFIQGIPYSFTNRASVVSQNYDFVGLKNYVELLTNKYFQQAFLHTVQFTVIYVIGANVLGLALALMLSRSSKFNNLARTIMFIPFTVALTSGAIVWSYVFTDVYSPLFQKMSPLGLSSQVIPAMAVIAIWRDMGYCMLIYLAGLQSISGEYYEAAKVDGANGIQSFFRITLPLIAKNVLTLCIPFTLWRLTTFDLVYSMTSGGPGEDTALIAYRITTEAFTNLNVGYASALAMLLFVVMAIFSWLNIRVMNKFDS